MVNDHGSTRNVFFRGKFINANAVMQHGWVSFSLIFVLNYEGSVWDYKVKFLHFNGNLKLNFLLN